MLFSLGKCQQIAFLEQMYKRESQSKKTDRCGKPSGLEEGAAIQPAAAVFAADAKRWVVIDALPSALEIRGRGMAPMRPTENTRKIRASVVEEKFGVYGARTRFGCFAFVRD